MGYWKHGEGGLSFVVAEDPDNQMIWGDAPADIMGNAIWEITVAFARDVGRMPSKKEIIEGIKFTTNVLDRYADEPKDAPALTDEQQAIIEVEGWKATGGDEPISPKRLQASERVNAVLEPLYKKGV